MRTQLLFAALPLLAGCAAAGAPKTAPPAPAAFLDQQAMLLLMEDREQLDPDGLGLVLVAGLGPGGEALRSRTALALGRIGDPRGIAALTSMLEDASDEVRRSAIFALGEISEGGAKQGRERIMTSLLDPDREVGRRAVEAAAKAGVPLEEVASRLIEVPSGELLPRLLPSLFRFDSPGLVRWAELGLEEKDSALRRAAGFALGRTARPEGAGVMRRLLTDIDPLIRAWAARGLGRCGTPADLELLLPLLADPEDGPVVQALRAGRRLAGTDEASPASLIFWRDKLLPLLSDPRPARRIAALEEIAAFLPDPVLGARLAELTASALPRERELALLALAEAGDPRAAAALERLRGDGEKSVRAAAVRAAAFLEDEAALAAFAGDRDPLVRRTLLEVLLAQEPAALAAAEAALEDDDFSVRAAALDWLAEHPQPGLGRLADAWGRAKNDRAGDADAMLSAVKALRAHAKEHLADHDTVVILLEAAAQKGDFLVRRAARAALAELGEKPPALGPASEQGLETYRQLYLLSRAKRFAELRTAKGNVRLEIDCPEAPRTCHQFFQLAGQGYYDGLRFHRIVPDFVVQTGDPRGDGVGGPGYALRDEINRLPYDRGAVGLAHSGPDTAGSQFFITLSPQPYLEGGYPVFGKVVAGFEVLPQLIQGDTLLAVAEVR
jgi:peptidyl-prolyl cis-trans isomerase B (cyclophilin B)